MTRNDNAGPDPDDENTDLDTGTAIDNPNLDANTGIDTRAPDTDTWRQVAQRHYDPDRDDELTTSIVLAIAEAADVLATELKSPPLYETIDVAAIEDAFFGVSVRNESRGGSGEVRFCHDGYLVRVKNDGWIQVYETGLR